MQTSAVQPQRQNSNISTMKKDSIIENQEFTSYWLSHASADVVFEWLRENKPLERYGASREEEIEKILIGRNEPLINLGLALYGHQPETGLSLFRSGDKTIKKAALAGTSVSFNLFGCWVETSGVLKELLESFDDELDLLKSFLSNKFIPDELLVSLYERRAPFGNLTDKQWCMAIGRTSSNSRLSTPYDGIWDGDAEYSYNKVFTTGWKLFETLPVDTLSAVVLSALGEQLVPNKPYDMDVFITIKRWKIESSNDGFDWNCGRCRFALAGLIGEYQSEFKSLKDSDDVILRESYYRRFRTRKPEEVRELFEKDNDKFLDGALYNPKLYINETVREELRQCCWDYKHPHYGLDYPNTFRKQVERFVQEHPDWFTDYDGDIPFNEVKDPILRTNKQIEYLQKRIKTISQKLIGSESEDQPSLIEDMKTKIDEVKITLTNSNQFLSEQLSKLMAIRWGWLIIGLLIGYILAKQL